MLYSNLLSIIAIMSGVTLLGGFALSSSVLVGLLFFGVILVGLPHGGLDHRVGVSLLQTLGGDSRRRESSRLGDQIGKLIAFITAYLFVAAIVVAGWYVMPTVTVVCFFAFAAWHFGLEEEYSNDLSWWHHFGIAARGGMVIWCTAYFRTNEVGDLLQTILPTDAASGIWIAQSIQTVAPMLAMVLLADVLRCLSVANTIRIASFAFMFAVCPVLLSFAIYFCGWHSIKGLMHLRRDFEMSWPQLAMALLPMSVLAAGLFAGAASFYQSELSLADSTIRATFMGLSAVAIPHLLLHVISDALKSNANINTNAPADFDAKSDSRQTASKGAVAW